MVFDGATPIPHKGWMVCMRLNAKNRMGGYIGQHLMGLLIKEDSEVGVVIGADKPIPAAHHCDGRKYEPFTL
jgi:hypothetical protein